MEAVAALERTLDLPHRLRKHTQREALITVLATDAAVSVTINREPYLTRDAAMGIFALAVPLAHFTL